MTYCHDPACVPLCCNPNACPEIERTIMNITIGTIVHFYADREAADAFYLPEFEPCAAIVTQVDDDNSTNCVNLVVFAPGGDTSIHTAVPLGDTVAPVGSFYCALPT